ncbi:glutathione S-transferase family protein [Tabrizicola sp.]|uniref:glutathione S-transferase family protein n=1 Tax=Tabrizicola sp. TaxID=2005166 RepID=UPI002733342C|nr:glutathione S-transferase family protein [Tabrizicola sp.]MDP3193869.1 glutathione S-transferase family protein [Tabrizicola sp.]MDZ4065255.1 glutathione S-transferase family protein [Tabrizicola sp.]
MRLYYSQNLNPRVAVAAARYLKAPVDYIAASPMHPDHQDAFRKINPNTRVPVLTAEGRTYWEADAIACKLSALAGADFWRTDNSQPEMIMWISWATHHLNSAGGVYYFWNLIAPQFMDFQPEQSVFDEAMRDWRQFMGILDTQLQGREWLVDDRLSYADFRVATCFPFAKAAGLPLADFPQVQRLADQLSQLDAWRDPFAGLA